MGAFGVGSDPEPKQSLGFSVLNFVAVRIGGEFVAAGHNGVVVGQARNAHVGSNEPPNFVSCGRFTPLIRPNTLSKAQKPGSLRHFL